MSFRSQIWPGATLAAVKIRAAGMPPHPRAILSRMASSHRWLLLAALPSGVSGCGGRTPLDGELSYLDYAGGSFATGGSPSTGGYSGSGFGGAKATGGKAGTSTGGYHATGGAIGAVGGAKVIPTGGTKSTGGATSHVATGGTKSTGGSKATLGGSNALGGTVATGGVRATGGSITAGGIQGTGGTQAAGGTTAGSGGFGTGGTSSVGGSPVTGGSPSTGGSSACPSYLLPNEELIDDMDDGTAAIPQVNGRRGAWSDYLNDTSGAFMVPDPSVAFYVTDTGDICRKYAVYVYGQTSTDPGAGAQVGFSLGSPYNASAYTGLSFWAKIDANTGTPLRVTFPDGDTDPRGAVCQTNTTDPTLTCWDDWGLRLSLTATWTKYTVPFSSLTQDTWGYQAQQFDPKTLYSVQFEIGDTDTFGIWIDSVAFTL